MPFLPNGGLDNFGSDAPNYNSGTPLSTGTGYCRYLGLGTGALTPSNSTTDLVTPLGSRSNDDGGFSATSVFTAEADHLKHVTEFVRVYDFTASHTLTEWALFVDSSGGNCSFVDRFREDPDDTGSAEVSISVQDGDQLQMYFTHSTLLYPYGATAFDMTLTTDGSPSTVSGDKTLYGDSNTDYTSAFVAWSPSQALASTSQPEMGLYSSVTTANTGGGTELADSGGFSGGLAAYTTSNYYRDKEYTFSTSEGNGSIAGFFIGISGGAGGCKVVFDTPITKTSLQTLKVTFRSSWARA
jgi:hypothetical protein